MKTVCLYYSRSGRTKSIMERMANMLDADLFEYTDGKDRGGVKGYVGSCIDSYRPLPQVEIIGGEPDWDKYDRVIVAMPVWAEAPCVVGKAFLKQYSGKFKGDLHLVVTHMSKAGYGKAIAKAYVYSAVKPKSYLSLQTKNHDCGAEIKHFVKELEAGSR